MLYLLIALALFDVAAIVAIIILRHKRKKKQRQINHYGDSAEERVSAYIRRQQPGCFLLNNIYLRTDVGLTQLDHILICHHGIFVIETKSHNGHIVTGSHEWVQYYKEKTVKFFNPTLQNQIHKKALRQVLDTEKSLSGVPVYGVIVFTSHHVTFSNNVKDVIKLPQLGGFIRKNGMIAQTARSQSKSMPPKTNTARPRKRGGLSRSKMIQIERLILSKAEKSRFKQDKHRNKVQNLTKKY